MRFNWTKWEHFLEKVLKDLALIKAFLTPTQRQQKNFEVMICVMVESFHNEKCI